MVARGRHEPASHEVLVRQVREDRVALGVEVVVAAVDHRAGAPAAEPLDDPGTEVEHLDPVLVPQVVYQRPVGPRAGRQEELQVLAVGDDGDDRRSAAPPRLGDEVAQQEARHAQRVARVLGAVVRVVPWLARQPRAEHQVVRRAEQRQRVREAGRLDAGDAVVGNPELLR